jgi:hypothetical protein
MSIILSAEVAWAEDGPGPANNRQSKKRTVLVNTSWRAPQGDLEEGAIVLFSAGIEESRRRDRIYRGAGAREGGNIILAGDGVAHL